MRALIDALKDVISPDKQDLIPINEEALKEGARLVARQ